MGGSSLTTGAPSQLGMAPGTETSIHFPSWIVKKSSSHGETKQASEVDYVWRIFSVSKLTCPGAARVTVPPGVVHHPALAVHLGDDVMTVAG